MVGAAFAPGTPDVASVRVAAADRWARPAVCTVCAPALAVPAASRPTAAEAVTARKVRIDRLIMTFPLHSAVTAAPRAPARAGPPTRRLQLPEQPDLKHASQQKCTWSGGGGRGGGE